MRHFDELYERYHGPVFVFDLIRQAERRARETTLGKGLGEALQALSMRMRREAHPLEGGIRYVPFDFKKESKRKGGDVLQSVEKIAAYAPSAATPAAVWPPPPCRRGVCRRWPCGGGRLLAQPPSPPLPSPASTSHRA